MYIYIYITKTLPQKRIIIKGSYIKREFIHLFSEKFNHYTREEIHA